MTIHSTHPFADPEPDPVRRFRGRLGGAVTLWTTGSDAARSGLTITSLMVANGETASILALVDPDSDFLDGVRETGRCVVQGPVVVRARLWPRCSPAPRRRPVAPSRTADFEQTAWGPRLVAATSWAYRRSRR